MFDRFGRIRCAECTANMKTTRYDDHEVEFSCENPICGHSVRMVVSSRPPPLQDVA